MGLDVVVDALEYFIVAVVVGDDPLHRLVQLLHKLRVGIALAEPGGAGFGHRIQQLAGRMLRPQEELAVVQGSLRNRYLQAHQQLHRRRVALHFTLDLVVEQAQQFKGVRVLLHQRCIRPVLFADLRQQGVLHIQHGPARLARLDRDRDALQRSQGAEHVVRGHGNAEPAGPSLSGQSARRASMARHHSSPALGTALSSAAAGSRGAPA